MKNQIHNRQRIAAILGAMILAPGLASAQGGGAVIIRIPDGAQSRCINANQDRVWLTLRRAIVEKKGNWLKEDSKVSVLVTAQMRVTGGKPVSFPLIADADVKNYSNGQVSVPVEYTFIDGFALKEGSTTYSGATLDITLFNQAAKTTWGSALTALSEVAKKLPLPSGPVTQSVTYLMDFAMSALNKDTEKVDASNKAKSATIALNFDPTGVCSSGGFEEAGTLAVVQDLEGSAPAPDGVRVANVNEYCWTADLQPAFVLKAAKKEPGALCTDAARYASKYKQVSNNYLGLVLNAVKVSGVLGPNPDDVNVRRRCEANGLRMSDCVPSR